VSTSPRHAVIDIGSNSVRLVVFNGPTRAPSVLFNEKVMAGLGRGVVSTGKLDAKAMKATLRSLARFRYLAAQMGVETPITVATAAVRQASNGKSFLDAVKALGLPVSLLSGDEEAEAAGFGVIAGFENPNGIVGDLGGGSLELARVEGGRVLERESFRLGVLRLAAIREHGVTELRKQAGALLEARGWAALGEGLPFYLVGGSWRSLAKIHMFLARYPLPIVHHYSMPPMAAASLVGAVETLDRNILKEKNIVSSARYPAMADAAALLAVLTSLIQPQSLIVSATGLREGLHYRELAESERALDPLIVAARAEGDLQARFPGHGDLLHDWIAPLFAGDPDGDLRLRLAACLLGDIGWAANPDFRAERGLEVALHGNWLGLDARGRAMIGQALFSTFGGGNERPAILGALASTEDLNRARNWGLAMRLGQRLSGGIAAPLGVSRVSISDDSLILSLTGEAELLLGDAVERRLRQLATALGRTPEISRS
jgi:exopolyphosphatase/guanosine-5'-triphosphate,3'-diphosphate pyrophosphatase